jgi:hypothetical protein
MPVSALGATSEVTVEAAFAAVAGDVAPAETAVEVAAKMAVELTLEVAAEMMVELTLELVTCGPASDIETVTESQERVTRKECILKEIGSDSRLFFIVLHR